MGACGRRNARFALLLFVLSAAAVGGCAGDGGPAATGEADPLVEAIFYTSLGPPNWDVYLFDGPEAEPSRLTDDPARDYNAVFSPDGRWVVFTSERAGNADLWALDLEPDRLDIMDTSMHPRFSPDGEWIVFTSDRSYFNDEWALTWFPQPYGDLWALPVSGGEAVRLTHNKWEDGPNDWGFARFERPFN